jgi:type I restriction enzyme M protein
VVLPDGSLFGEGVKTRLKEHLMEECNLHTIVRLPNSVFRPYASIGTNLLFFEKGVPTREIWFYEHRVPPGQKAYSMTRPIRLEHLQPCIDWWSGAERKGRVESEHAWKVDIRAIIEDARARAQPHWDEAERHARREARLKACIAEASEQIRALQAEPLTRGARRNIEGLQTGIEGWRKEAGEAGAISRRERAAGDGIYASAFNLDIKNPHSVDDDFGDPEEWLAKLEAAECETAVLRDQLKGILEEALLR